MGKPGGRLRCEGTSGGEENPLMLVTTDRLSLGALFSDARVADRLIAAVASMPAGEERDVHLEVAESACGSIAWPRCAAAPTWPSPCATGCGAWARCPCAGANGATYATRRSCMRITSGGCARAGTTMRPTASHFARTTNVLLRLYPTLACFALQGLVKVVDVDALDIPEVQRPVLVPEVIADRE